MYQNKAWREARIISLSGEEVRILRALVRKQMGDQFERVQPTLEANKPELAGRISRFAHRLSEIYGKLL